MNNKGLRRYKVNKVIAIILIIIISLFLSVVLCIKFNIGAKFNAGDKLNELAKIFYKYYYNENKLEDKEETRKSFKEWKEIGLTIKLKDLKIYLDNHKKEDYSVLDKCDDDLTRITIYPVSPYDENDYKITTELKCD